MKFNGACVLWLMDILAAISMQIHRDPCPAREGSVHVPSESRYHSMTVIGGVAEW